MTLLKTCRFICVNGLHQPVILPNLVSVCIGRAKEFEIKDLRCSRRQVLLTADYGANEVIVKQEGLNPSEIDGILLKKNEVVRIKDGASLDIRQGNCVHKIEFTSCLQTPKVEKRAFNESNVFKERTMESKKVKTETVISKWDEVHNGRLLIYSYGEEEYHGKVAGFDLDGTIIKTKSGNVFPKDTSDWKISNDKVKQKLEKLKEIDYRILIFTNQAGIGTGRVRCKDFMMKIENIVKELNIPLQVFISTHEDSFRKPAPGMWSYFTTKVVNFVEIEESFFVGDAAGRVANWEPGKKKDFSMADRLFAYNTGLKFFTPEEYFMGNPQAPFANPVFDPRKCITEKSFCNNFSLPQKEVIVMVGAPGSGKSHFVKHNLITAGYVPVNRDNLRSWQKCVSLTSSALSANKSVVVDNTNPDIESRKRYINVAKENNVQVRCFIMDITIEHCHHNNKFREITDPTHDKISPIIINNYRKIFVPPKLEEGFKEIVKVPFVPKFTTLEQENLYKMFLLGK